MKLRTTTVIADAIAVLIFAILARLAHNSPLDPFTIPNILDTYWPFLIGALVGLGLCVATKSEAEDLGTGGILVWIATVAVGLGIWWLRNGQMPHWSFVMVATIASGILLMGWRFIARIVGKKKTS
ncbi:MULTISPECIES: DUF3054 domain-containing protein [unclassified Corynebacterium]|uniref:DUF3054 domain-containing protein n=1 Tax=unclassified Corynebacterium TaxID=2624378 RepID=UPI003098CA04